MLKDREKIEDGRLRKHLRDREDLNKPSNFVKRKVEKEQLGLYPSNVGCQIL